MIKDFFPESFSSVLWFGNIEAYETCVIGISDCTDGCNNYSINFTNKETWRVSFKKYRRVMSTLIPIFFEPPLYKELYLFFVCIAN